MSSAAAVVGGAVDVVLSGWVVVAVLLSPLMADDDGWVASVLSPLGLCGLSSAAPGVALLRTSEDWERGCVSAVR